jgi:peptidoglycan/xylan/chitin deacetylase (PgdA/CDA1 family)
VRSFDLFARALYADFLEIGSIAGTIPFEFDPNFDRFWIAPDAGAVILAKGGRNLFYYPLADGSQIPPRSLLPYIFLPRGAGDIKLLWSAAGLVTILISLPGAEDLLAYRLDTVPARINGNAAFSPLEAPPGGNMALSPDGVRALFWGPGGLVLYDYINWKPLAVLRDSAVYRALWTGNDEIIIAGRSRIERQHLLTGQRNLVCLSQAERFGYDAGSSRILALTGGEWYGTDGIAPWTAVSPPVLREPGIQSSRYRVYLENQVSGPYANIPMVRNISSVGTFPLITGIGTERETAQPEEPEAAGETGVFSRGRRTGPREAALVFDCLDDAQGLAAVLDALTRFEIRATFFLNGEFIRRHPVLVRSIVQAGHETASMFFAPIDLSVARYRIDREFISRGLARNEDEFFRAAQAELSLIWHAPYYTASREITDFAASAGYRTAGRDVDPMDWIQRNDAKRMGLNQLPASEMIDRIMARKKPGSIIPVRLGLLPGGRDDYLFNRLDVLLDALIRDGYTLVPVSVLMEHSR